MDRFGTWPLETPIARDFRTGYADRVVGRPGLHRPAGNAARVRDGLTSCCSRIDAPRLPSGSMPGSTQKRILGVDIRVLDPIGMRQGV